MIVIELEIDGSYCRLDGVECLPQPQPNWNSWREAIRREKDDSSSRLVVATRQGRIGRAPKAVV
jgi:hypothetical protein